MQLLADHISQFQQLYREEFGEDISTEEAYKQGMNLVRLVQMIYKPMPQDEFVRVKEEVNVIQERINKRKQM